MTSRITITLIVCFACLAGCTSKSVDLQSGAQATKAIATATVGMPVAMDDVILPGGELEPAAAGMESGATDQSGVLRIVRATPHGDDFRYSFVFYGLEPGDYDLANYLRPIPGGEPRELPTIPVKVTTLLPPGQVEPHTLTAGKLPGLGGYRRTFWALGILWAVGLLLLMFAFRRKPEVRTNASERQMTFADHLRPLMIAASQGTLSIEEQSAIERLLLSYWKDRLGVKRLSPAKAMDALKADPQAGELIRQLEAWLHAPDTPQDVDVEQLLAPYRGFTEIRVADRIATAGRLPLEDPRPTLESQG